MDDEQKRHIAELEGKVRELEARWGKALGVMYRLVSHNELPTDDDFFQLGIWLAAYQPEEEAEE